MLYAKRNLNPWLGLAAMAKDLKAFESVARIPCCFVPSNLMRIVPRDKGKTEAHVGVRFLTWVRWLMQICRQVPVPQPATFSEDLLSTASGPKPLTPIEPRRAQSFQLGSKTAPSTKARANYKIKQDHKFKHTQTPTR